MGKRWLCMLLLLAVTITAAPSACGAEGLEAPPAAEAQDVAREAAPAAEEPPAEEPPVEEVTVADEPAPAAAQGVTVVLVGLVEGVDRYCYDGPDGKSYNTRRDGTCWYPHPYDYGDNTPIFVDHTDTLCPQATVASGDIVRVWLDDARYDITTVENGQIVENYVNSFIGTSRYVDVQCPASGAVTIHITTTDDVLPELVPFTFYNEDWDSGVVVGGGAVVSGREENSRYAFGHAGDYDKVYTDSAFEEWVAPGYEIQVLEGGYIAEKRAPTGAAAAGVPAGTTCYVLHVNLGAERFVIAAVKQGEKFTPPAEDEEPAAPTETPQPTETPLPEGVIFADVPAGSWYENAVNAAYEKGIVKGVKEHTFDPDGVTTRGQAVTMLYRAMGSPAAESVFTDTKGETASAAGWAAAKGVTTGATETKFAPNAYVTREQLVTMLYRLTGSPAVNTDEALKQYGDGASVQSYARDAVVWALSTGLLNGYTDMTIRPAGYATRAEVCALIMRYLAM